MALKFLNKKGWHTGSLRNIENVWKAEQKHNAEQKKLDELRKQIHEERERSEFRLLQEQAGLVPAQERLDFLYDSGLAVGKSSSEGFKALEPPPQLSTNNAEASSSKPAVPGALFEDKPQSANDSWRKLHSDPLLLIRQKEQEALARIKNNPIQMAMIRKSVESKTAHKEEKQKKKERKKHHKKSKHEKRSKLSDSEGSSSEQDEQRGKTNRSTSSHHRDSKHVKCASRDHAYDSRGASGEGEERRKRNQQEDRDHQKSSISERHSYRGQSASEGDMNDRKEKRRRSHQPSEHRGQSDSEGSMNERKDGRNKSHRSSERYSSSLKHESENYNTRTDNYRRRPPAPKLSAEEKAARAREMQLDAELHEEQRWKRLKKASEADAREAARSNVSGGKNFLDAAQKSVFGTDKGGSSTIEESVRRRAFYSQGKSDVEGNAFRR